MRLAMIFYDYDASLAVCLVVSIEHLKWQNTTLQYTVHNQHHKQQSEHRYNNVILLVATRENYKHSQEAWLLGGWWNWHPPSVKKGQRSGKLSTSVWLGFFTSLMPTQAGRLITATWKQVKCVKLYVKVTGSGSYIYSSIRIIVCQRYN